METSLYDKLRDALTFLFRVRNSHPYALSDTQARTAGTIDGDRNGRR